MKVDIRNMKWLFAVFLLFVHGIACAQDEPGLIATTSTATVSQGQAFQVHYTLYNGRSQGFTQPSFNGFRLAGSFRSSGGGTTVIIQGQVVQSGSSEEKWTYTLVPLRTGKIEIEPFKAVVGGRIIESNTLTIEVLPTGSGQAQPQTHQPQTSGQTSEGRDIFVRAVADKTTTYVGGKVLLTYKLYTALNVSQYGISQSPSMTGFWVEEPAVSRQVRQSREVIDGKQFVVADIKQYVLYPQRSGQLRVEPLDLDVIVRVPGQSGHSDPFFDRFFNDPFFRNPFSQSIVNEKRSLKSNALTINVSPLPSSGKPASFTGGVGKFDVTAELSREELDANDATNLRITISGSGNIKLIDKPDINLHPELEVFEPRVEDRIALSEAGMSGSRTYDFTIIPRTQGKYSIPPYEMSFFDPSQNRYITIQTSAFDLNVLKGDGSISSAIGSVGRSDIQYLGQDIQFIKTSNLNLRKKQRLFFGSITYWSLFFAPLLLFIAALLYLNHRLKQSGNIASLKNRRANSIARKRLKKAGRLLKDAEKKEEFYNEVANALWQYLADKLSLSMSELSLEVIKQNLISRNIYESEILKVDKLLQECEFARYAPGDKQEISENIYKEAIDVISNLEKQLK